jgi:hypothetical protein
MLKEHGSFRREGYNRERGQGGPRPGATDRSFGEKAKVFCI